MNKKLFTVKKKTEDEIILEEESNNPFIVFFRKYAKIIYITIMTIAMTIFIVGTGLTIANFGKSSTPTETTTGIVFSLEGNNDISQIGKTPITDEYALKLFNQIFYNKDDTFVIASKIVTFEDGTIIFFRDNTALIKYNNGTYIKVEQLNNNYGVLETGVINTDAITRTITKIKEENGITYYSDGSVELNKDNKTILVKDQSYLITENNETTIIGYDNNFSKFIDTKVISLKNSTNTKIKYQLVIEETDNYNKYNTKRLIPEYLRFIYNIDSISVPNKINNNIWPKGTPLEGGLTITKDTYVLFEGTLDNNEEVNIDLGLWVDYNNITNDYQDASFIGTIKIYSETIVQ